MLQHWFSDKQSFDDQLIYFLFDRMHVVTLIGEEIEHRCKRSFVADVHVVLTGIEHELFAGLVDGVIGEMYEVVFQVFLLCPLVVFCCKAGQSFLIDVDPEWIATVDEHIDAHVELQTIDQQRVVHIELHNTRLALQLFELCEQHDSLALR